MRKSLVAVTATLGLGLVALSGGLVSAATGLTTCSVSVDHAQIYVTASADRYAFATFTTDTSATLVKPAEFYFFVVSANGVGSASNVQDTATHIPVTMSWYTILDRSTQGTVLSLSKPLEVDFQISNYPTISQPYVCRTAVTLMPNTSPAVPTGVSAIAGNAEAIVEWTDSNGFVGASYTVTALPGGSTCTADYPDTSCTVRGLTNGTPYTFKVTAESSGGISDPSVESAPVTPAAGGNDSGGSGGTPDYNLPALVEHRLPETGGGLGGPLGASALMTLAGMALRRLNDHRRR